jgi:hypothetical protein
MRRRKFITLIGGAASWPLEARAQQPRHLKVGTVGVQPRTAAIYVAFETRMAELGYEEGKNFTFEFVKATNVAGYGAALRDVVDRGVDIILSGGTETGLKAAIAVAGTRRS